MKVTWLNFGSSSRSIWTQTFVCLIALFSSDLAFSRGDIIPGSRYLSARGSAMGDAFLPLGDDGAAGFFYNPAALGKIRSFEAEPLNLQLSGNMGYFSASGVQFYKTPSLESYKTALKASPDTTVSMGSAVMPSVYFRGFGFGVLAQTRTMARYDSVTNQVRYRSKFFFIPTAGASLRFAGGVVRIGYSFQWVNLASGDVTRGYDENLGWNQNLAKGSAFSHNLGFALTFPVSFLPSVNLVARNILGAKYRTLTLIPLAPNSTGLPADEPMSYDAAVSMSPRLGQGLTVNYTAQLRDITSTSGVSILGRAAFGMEFNFRDQFFIRGGLGSMYPCAGVGFKRKTAEFNFSWFSEEVGTGLLSDRDMKFMIQYQIRAF